MYLIYEFISKVTDTDTPKKQHRLHGMEAHKTMFLLQKEENQPNHFANICDKIP